MTIAQSIKKTWEEETKRDPKGTTTLNMWLESQYKKYRNMLFCIGLKPLKYGAFLRKNVNDLI